MNERDDCLTRHIAAEDQLIRAVELPRIQKLAPTNIRPVNVCRKENCSHMQIL